jgi:hypothetical protein
MGGNIRGNGTHDESDDEDDVSDGCVHPCIIISMSWQPANSSVTENGREKYARNQKKKEQ